MSHLEPRVRFSCTLARAESRRPNPHKSVALAVQERPFLAALAPRLNERGRPVGDPSVAPLFARGGWNLVWRNRDSFIKSFSTDDARTKRRYIICIRAIEGVMLAFGIGRRYRRWTRAIAEKSSRANMNFDARRKYVLIGALRGIFTKFSMENENLKNEK